MAVWHCGCVEDWGDAKMHMIGGSTRHTYNVGGVAGLPRHMSSRSSRPVAGTDEKDSIHLANKRRLWMVAKRAILFMLQPTELMSDSVSHMTRAVNARAKGAGWAP